MALAIQHDLPGVVTPVILPNTIDGALGGLDYDDSGDPYAVMDGGNSTRANLAVDGNNENNPAVSKAERMQVLETWSG